VVDKVHLAQMYKVRMGGEGKEEEEEEGGDSSRSNTSTEVEYAGLAEVAAAVMR
jgi:hypothetical protein